jgi:hypothetical protein
VFDLESYLFANKHMPNLNLRWKCPVCQKTAQPADLVVDELFCEILVARASVVAVGGRAPDEILFEEDGTWSFPAARSPAGGSASGGADEDEEYDSGMPVKNEEEVVLCLSDDEESAGPSARINTQCSREVTAPEAKRRRTEVIDLCDD